MESAFDRVINNLRDEWTPHQIKGCRGYRWEVCTVAEWLTFTNKQRRAIVEGYRRIGCILCNDDPYVFPQLVSNYPAFAQLLPG